MWGIYPNYTTMVCKAFNNYVLRDFRRWLINEKLEQYGHIKRAQPQTTISTTI
jgi:hypothetical protein